MPKKGDKTAAAGEKKAPAAGAKAADKKKKPEKKNPFQPVTREYTINVHKRVHGVYHDFWLIFIVNLLSFTRYMLIIMNIA